MSRPVRARLLIWLAPLPLAAVPLLLVLARERGDADGAAESVILAPGLLGLFPALILGLSPDAAVLIVAGVYWYLLGTAAANALVGRATLGSRALLLALLLATAIVAWLGAGWDVD